MRKKILIVEDELSIVQLLSLVLAKAGYETHVCQSGRDAIKTPIGPFGCNAPRT